MTNKTALVIPTCNAGKEFEEVAKKIYDQSSRLNLVRVYDSESNDLTVKIAESLDFEVIKVSKKSFSHSATRSKIAQEMYENGFDYLIFMTQDVYLQNHAIELLLKYIIKNSNCGVVYGKQEIDLEKGSINEYFARSFNYGSVSSIKTKKDVENLGIKTIFNSDAFAVYNLKLAKKVGFFGEEAVFGEDMIIADKFIQRGYGVGYCAESRVFHTHNYTLLEEFSRYKVIGQFHKMNNEIINRYGKTNSEGIRLALGEIKYLISEKKVYKIPESLLRNAAKFFGFKLGFMRGKANV